MSVLTIPLSDMSRRIEIEAFSRLLKLTRSFFDERGYLEVLTPHIVRAGAFEACIDVFSLTNGKQLHSSPEMEMKRVLAENRRAIYQICRCFREDPDTGVHWPEFTMLEFYRPETNYRDMIQLMREYLGFLVGSALQFSEVTYWELLASRVGFEVTDSLHALRKKADVSNLELSANDDRLDILTKAWVQCVEPNLDRGPVIVKGYPIEMGALAHADGAIVERFEIYWNGMEICNGCTELIDSKELKERYKRESELRINEGKQPHPEPKDLFDVVAKLPKCAGVAVGLERLALCLS